MGAVRLKRRRLGVGWTRVTCRLRGSIDTQGAFEVASDLVVSLDVEPEGILTQRITFT